MPNQPVPAPAHHDLEDVIDHIIALCLHNGLAQQGKGRVSVADLMDMLGERSFGPLLLVPSLIAVSPVGAIPGLPAITSAVIVLIAGQILLGHEHFWIPRWLARRSVDAHRMERGLEKFRPVARFIDHLLRPRLPALTGGVSFYAIALLCLLSWCPWAASRPMRRWWPFRWRSRRAMGCGRCWPFCSPPPASPSC